MHTIPLLEALLLTYPNKQFVENLLTGFMECFYTGIKCLPTEAIMCRNPLSSGSQPIITWELLQKEAIKVLWYDISEKFHFSKIPYDVYRINTIGIAEEKYSKKKRLIVDSSS